MKIAVNTRLLLKDKLEGIGWFTYETLKRITQAHPEHEFLFIFDRQFSDEFIFSKNVSPLVAFPPARHPFLYWLWFEFAIPRLLNKHNADMFLSPDGFLSLSTKIPSMGVIHDINFKHRPKDLPYLTQKYYNHFFPKFAQKAVRIATVSEYSKQDICKSYKIPDSKVDVVYNGANEKYKPLNEEKVKRIRDEVSHGKPYFVFIGALHPRKNIAGLLKAYDTFRKSTPSEIKLLIVGNEMFKTSEIAQIFSSMQYKSEVIFTGRLEPEKLREVLGSALALTFVPYFEGFGIPILEAFYCNVPVISSNVTSMPEVGGKAVLYVDPFSTDSIVDGMKKIAFDEKLRTEMIAKGEIQREKFSWDKTAQNLWISIEKALNN